MNINQELTKIAKDITSNSPFETALKDAIDKKIRELKKDHTTGMSIDNLKQVVKAPSASLQGAPKGPNAQHVYSQMFTELCKKNPFCRTGSLRQDLGELKTASKDVKKIKVDWNSASSISNAERQKSKLEDQGYSLVQTIGGLSTSELVYSKESRTASSNDPILKKVADVVSKTSFMGLRRPLEALKIGKVDTGNTTDGMTWMIKMRNGKTIAIASDKTADSGPDDIIVGKYYVGYL